MIDEYGRTAGIVTVEDIIEEVVGEIDDETDPLGGAVRRLSNGDWFVRGHVAITDLLDYGLELPVDSDAYNSVGGFVFGELGRLPKRGDTVTHNGYSIRVESVRENRIEAVRIRERRAGGLEPDRGLARAISSPGADLGLHDPAAVDPRAVGGAEVARASSGPSTMRSSAWRRETVSSANTSWQLGERPSTRRPRDDVAASSSRLGRRCSRSRQPDPSRGREVGRQAVRALAESLEPSAHSTRRLQRLRVQPAR